MTPPLLCTDFRPEPFAALEQLVFERPWQASAFSEGTDRLAFSLYQHDQCLAFLYGNHVLDEAEIWRVVTHPNHRRRGFARTLIHALINRCQDLAITRIFLEVSGQNHNARAFYQALDFDEQGCRRNYYGPGDDAIIMVRQLIAK